MTFDSVSAFGGCSLSVVLQMTVISLAGRRWPPASQWNWAAPITLVALAGAGGLVSIRLATTPFKSS